MADQLIAFVKHDCPTCQLVEPVLREIAERRDLVVYTQDDPEFPSGPSDVRYDQTLEQSYRMDVQAVPTLLRCRDGIETERTEGWHRDRWEQLTGLSDLGPELPVMRPGCGALNVDIGMPERLALRFGGLALASRVIEIADPEDSFDVMYDRGWTDGLPVVPPTDLRVARMLAGTPRPHDEVVGLIPPNLHPCTVEKVAINATMAGCRPEYMPVVLGALEAALLPAFAMHGLLCTMHFAGPIVIVNGPVTRRIGMNSLGNALGQGNRANATIGRALQLIIRNVGGGLPGEIDRAILGNPGKYTFCFAEDESDPAWMPLSVRNGIASGASAVTLFHGEGVSAFSDNRSRGPEPLIRSMAMALWRVSHPKSASDASGGALFVLSPSHYEILTSTGWGRLEIEEALWDALRRPGHEVVRDEDGVPMGVDPARRDELVDKFRRENFLLVRAGGQGGSISAIVGGWTAQRFPDEVRAVTKEII